MRPLRSISTLLAVAVCLASGCAPRASVARSPRSYDAREAQAVYAEPSTPLGVERAARDAVAVERAPTSTERPVVEVRATTLVSPVARPPSAGARSERPKSGRPPWHAD